MSSFVHLTLALKGLFDKPLSALPEALRQRVKTEFCLIPWDELSAEDRRIVARQCDYPDDPETEQERRFWWKWAGRKEAIMAQVTEWEAVATPTALDLTEKQIQLAKLKQELARIEAEVFVGATESDTANQTKLMPGMTPLTASATVRPVKPVPVAAMTKMSAPLPPLKLSIPSPPVIESAPSPPTMSIQDKPDVGSPEWRSQNARNAANVLHDKPGGNRDKQRQIRKIWATGKFSSRDRCAEEEYAALKMSFAAARRALKSTPEPSRC